MKCKLCEKQCQKFLVLVSEKPELYELRTKYYVLSTEKIQMESVKKKFFIGTMDMSDLICCEECHTKIVDFFKKLVTGDLSGFGDKS